MLTIEELKDRISSSLDEVTILEVLDIKAQDLVEAFHDKIVDRYDTLVQEFESDDDSL